MRLVATFTSLLQFLRPLFTRPSFDSFRQLLTGWVFARRRTVTGMIQAADVVGQKHHSSFHRFFSAARWSLDPVGLHLFALYRRWTDPDRVKLTLDDTLAHKRGLSVYGAGMHHDPLLSSRRTTITTWGHSWVILSVAVHLPFAPERTFSLPLLCRLYLNHKAAARWRVVPRTRPELAVQMLHVLCGHFPEQYFHLTVDAGYAGQSVLAELPPNCGLTSRLPLDARLVEAPPLRAPGQVGRPRVRGHALPSPQQMLKDRAARLTLNLYGRQDRVRVCTAEGRWHSVPQRPLRIVAVEPLTGGRPKQAFYSTQVSDPPLQVLSDYAERWSSEEVHENSKQYLGFEEPQGWTKRAVLRTGPIALLLYGLVIHWFAVVGAKAYRPPWRPWYRTKKRPSFADMLATLKRLSWRETISATLGSRRVPKNLEASLDHAIQLAA